MNDIKSAIYKRILFKVFSTGKGVKNRLCFAIKLIVLWISNDYNRGKNRISHMWSRIRKMKLDFSRIITHSVGRI